MSKIWVKKENVAKLEELYKAAVEEKGATVASSTEFLDELGKTQFGEDKANARQIRGKLTSMGIYVKPEQQASVAKASPIRKEHIVRAIGNTLGIDIDTIDSLKGAKADSLNALAEKLGVTDVLVAAKDYSPRAEMVVMHVMESLEVDLDDLETYQCELEEAAEQNGEE
jgi:hypothetical protein